MKKFIDLYNEIEEKLLVFSLVFTVILIFIQVIMRYIFNNSLTWSEELARYIFIWQCWLGVSLSFRKRSHINITMITDNLKGKSKLFLEVLAYLITLAFTIFLVVEGTKLLMFMLNRGTSSPSLKIPLAVVYASLPVACFASSFRIVGIIKEKIDAFKLAEKEA